MTAVQFLTAHYGAKYPIGLILYKSVHNTINDKSNTLICNNTVFMLFKLATHSHSTTAVPAVLACDTEWQVSIYC